MVNMEYYLTHFKPILQNVIGIIIVYKGVHVGGHFRQVIVAEYVGRLKTPEDIDELALRFAILYNTQVMYENEIPGTKNYFRRKHALKYLALQPDAVISKNIKKSKTNRVYGCHMNAALKGAGERYTKEWLLTIIDYDEEGKPITVIDRLYSMRLIEELISYYSKGNFDLVSSLFMCMIQVQEEPLSKEYEDNKRSNRTIQLLLKQLE